MNPLSVQFLCRSMTGCGKHALEHLPLELTAVGAKKPLVITSKSVTAAKATTHVANAFTSSGMTIGMVDSVSAMSGIDTVDELATLYQDKGFDAILALGGASIANVSKVVNIAVSNTRGNLKTLAGDNRINRPLNPLFYLPSGSGTGFETAGEARVESLAFSSMFLMPDKVIIDPRLMSADTVSTLAGQAMATLACCAEAHCTTVNPWCGPMRPRASPWSWKTLNRPFIRCSTRLKPAAFFQGPATGKKSWPPLPRQGPSAVTSGPTAPS